MYEQDVEQLKRTLKEKDEEIVYLRNELNEVNLRLEGLVEQAHRELKLVKKIQSFLVPTQFPNLSGFEFSSKFVPSMIKGGDYFDVVDQAERMKVGIVMSCSSGYAMSALFMSVLMKFSGLRALSENSGVSETVQAMASDLVGNMNEGDNASLFFAFINRRTYELEYSLLGDVVVFYFDNSEGEVTILQNQHKRMGDFEAKSIETSTIALNPRDRVVLCSAGIFESTDLSGKKLEVQEMARHLKSVATQPVHELRNEVLYQVEKFTSGAEIKRDRTVVAIEVKDRVIKLASK